MVDKNISVLSLTWTMVLDTNSPLNIISIQKKKSRHKFNIIYKVQCRYIKGKGSVTSSVLHDKQPPLWTNTLSTFYQERRSFRNKRRMIIQIPLIPAVFAPNIEGAPTNKIMGCHEGCYLRIFPLILRWFCLRGADWRDLPKGFA